MKICTKCGDAKAETEYFVKDRKSGRLHAQCKACYKKHREHYTKQHYETYRASYLLRAAARNKKMRHEYQVKMFQYLSTKACEICGEGDIRVLEFDHIDGSKKLFTISQGTRLGYSWERILEEIKKCRILCANCHKRRTAVQFNWYRLNKKSPEGL